MIQKLVRDGKVAVLYSPGFGAGWSSWNSDHRDFALFDAGLVALAERGATAEEAKRYAVEKTGTEYFCILGWRDIKIAWMDPGTGFKIEEYDGSESIITQSDLDWVVS